MSSVSALSLPSSRTALSYSNGVQTMESTKTSDKGFWSNVFPNRQRDNNPEQESVDEYLEFLDRRYNRLRHEEEEETAPARVWSWGWLMDDNNKPENVAQQVQQNDALYALGVAELASEKLLQKHHISLQSSDKSTAASGLFGRPKEPTASATLLHQKVRKSMALRSKALLRIPKQVLIVAAKNIPALTCFSSTLLFLSVRLVIALAPVFRDS
eukprot:CAMPEP_0194198856 /NCGR_PEP_ID=MMETSP0156-20130528/80_1 /TAXON_ID=33649 /ORGANISM="Thalassionema nitzschioides, Strain L26-B" /LENGTH=212 /DNA_ID=CAMNT_0038923685 /DNA_START=116 /DNA_END=754 /DNA_ORIENTATION=+